MTRGVYSRSRGQRSQSIGGRLGTNRGNVPIPRLISEDSETQPPSPTQSPLRNSLLSPSPSDEPLASGAQHEHTIVEATPDVQPSETSHWRTGGPIHITPRTFQYVYIFHSYLSMYVTRVLS